MQTITTIGLDIAKSVFQVHGVDVTVRWLSAVQLKRPPPRCLLREAAALPGGHRGLRPDPHHWSRETTGTWPHRAADAAGIRKALR